MYIVHYTAYTLHTVIIAKVRELRENSISILHNALFEGVSIITITLVMK